MAFDPTLRDRLCELEPQNPLLRERHNKELQAMLEIKLPWPMKVFLVLVSVASVAIAIFLGTLAVIHDELPALARGGMAGGREVLTCPGPSPFRKRPDRASMPHQQSWAGPIGGHPCSVDLSKNRKGGMP